MSCFPIMLMVAWQFLVSWWVFKYWDKMREGTHVGVKWEVVLMGTSKDKRIQDSRVNWDNNVEISK